MTTTEAILFAAFVIALGYAFYLQEKLTTTTRLLKFIVEDEAKYQILRQQLAALRKQSASTTN
jgi:Tfp pilus assembly protein PilO